MKKLLIGMLFASTAFGPNLAVAEVSAKPAAPVAPSAAIIDPFPCNGFSTPLGSVKALATSALYTVHRDFSGNIENNVSYPPGTFGPNLLFNTTVTVGGTVNSCLLATLSVNAQPQDNAMVFQALIDGNPMLGQWNPKAFFEQFSPPPPPEFQFPANFNVPIVWLHNLWTLPGTSFDGIDPPHFATYTFTARVAPGSHTLQVRVAGCCHAKVDMPPSTVGGYIRSATFAIQHR